MSVLGGAYRTYALDFWGFGESGAKRSTYAVDDFVSLVDQFMEQLGIGRAPLVGHSMGGTVSLLVACRYPERVEKVVVISSPIVGSSLCFFPRVFGYRAVGWLTYHNLWVYQWLYHMLAPMYSKDPNWAVIMDRGVSRTAVEAFFASIGSLRRADLRASLDRIEMPVMGMYGTRDNVVDPRQWQLLQEGLRHVQIELFPRAGHFLMLDEPGEFIQKLRVFLEESRDG
jgi:pimeloyl-ACP methyl ester carboxylesterase